MKNEPAQTNSNTLLAAAIVLPVLLRIVALFLPVDRLWGFDVLRGVSLWEQIAYSLLPLVALLLLRRDAAQFVNNHVVRNGQIIAAWGLLLLLLATLLWPMGTFFYGDGGLFIPQIHRFSIDGNYDTALLLNLKSSPLTGAMVIAAMHAVPAVGSTVGLGYPGSALYPFQAVSVLALLGASLYILFALPRSERPAAMLLLGGTAGVLLMFGYVEYYTPVFAALLVFLLAAERALRGEGSVGVALIAWVVAFGAHYLSLALLPAVLYLLAVRFPAFKPAVHISAHPFRAAAMLIIVFIAGYWLMGFGTSDNRILMPAKEISTGAGTLRYTLFSVWHLTDIVNLFFLLAPSAVVLIAGAFFRRNKDIPTNISAIRFALMATLFLAIFYFFSNTSLGLARDWDLTAPLGICLLFTAMLMVRRSGPSAVVALGIASLLLTIPWIAGNTRSAVAAERFERIVQLDDEHMYGDYAISGYEVLRKYYRNQSTTHREIALTRRMIEILDYPQHYRELLDAAVLLHSGDAEEYDGIQQWMLDRLHRKAQDLQTNGRQRDYSIGLDEIDSLAQGIGIQALTLRVPFPEVALRGIATVTRSGRPWPGIEGMRAYAGGNYALADTELEAALSTGFASPQVYLFSGNTLALTGRHAAALDRLEQGVSVFPDNAMLRYTLGKYYARAGVRPERAAELLLWCLENGVPKNRQQEIGELLRLVTGN